MRARARVSAYANNNAIRPNDTGNKERKRRRREPDKRAVGPGVHHKPINRRGAYSPERAGQTYVISPYRTLADGGPRDIRHSVRIRRVCVCVLYVIII